jgi:hypothetical protein
MNAHQAAQLLTYEREIRNGVITVCIFATVWTCGWIRQHWKVSGEED